MSDKSKTITINEFRQWLSGVEEMQDDDWVPDSKQWAKIRAKISDILESPTPKENSQVAYNSTRVNEGYSSPRATSDFAIPPGGFNSSHLNGGPAQLSIMNTKTPDIDSSNGYKSNFA